MKRKGPHIEALRVVGRWVLVAGVLGLSISCGSSISPDTPAADISGDWRASQFFGHDLSVWELRLTQNGRRIDGIACYSSNNFRASSTGLVAASYPTISFHDPGLLRLFTGAFDNNGRLGMTDGVLSLSFVRLTDSELRWCLQE